MPIFNQADATSEKERYRVEWHDWSQSENIEGLRQALEEEQDINEIVTNNYTSATIAARNDLLRLFEFLRENGADFTKLDGHQRSPMMWAAFEGAKRVAQKMLSRAGGDSYLAQRDPTGKQAIHFAALNGQADMLEILISKGADVNSVDEEGRSPLHYSMLGRSPNAVKVLMKHGANASLTDKKDRTPAKMPGGSTACRAAIESASDDVGFASFSSTMAAAGFGGMAAMAGGSSSSAGASGSSGFSGSFSGSSGSGLDPDSIEEMDEDELMAAFEDATMTTFNSHYVEMLIQSGGLDFHHCYSAFDDAMPLSLLAVEGSKKLMELAIQHGAPLDAVDSQSRTALMWAFTAENKEAAEALILAGANVDMADENAKTILDYANDLGDVSLINQINAQLNSSSGSKPRI